MGCVLLLLLLLSLSGKVPTRTVATAAAACAPRSGRGSAVATTAPTPSPSTSAARSTFSRRPSSSCPRRSGRASPTCWQGRHRRRSRSPGEEEAAGYSDTSASRGRNQHARVTLTRDLETVLKKIRLTPCSCKRPVILSQAF